MNRIDRYTATQFAKVTFFAIIAFSCIFILVDMVENLDDFLDENVPTHIIGLYYVYFLPRILGLMVPVALLLSSLFVVGKMSNTNELTIIKCSGMSLYRYLVPFLMIGFGVSLGMLYFDGWLVPKINAARLTLERNYLKKNLQLGGRYNMYFQDSGYRIISFEYFEESSGAARRATVQQFRADAPERMLSRVDAKSMRWIASTRTWKLFDATRREFIEDPRAPASCREVVTRFDSLDIGTLVITPAIILHMQQKPEELALLEFRDYISRQQKAGSDTDRLLVDYHAKIAFPFASLIVVFFGVPFASVKRRSGLSVQFGISIFIVFTYLVSQKLSQVFGYNGSIPAILAAWLPNAAFFLSGCVVMLRVSK